MQRKGKGFNYILKIMNERIDLSSLYDLLEFTTSLPHWFGFEWHKCVIPINCNSLKL
jgi:hypothetical protein